MRVVSIDSETVAISPGCLAPPLVCVQFDAGQGPTLVTAAGGAVARLRDMLRDTDVLLVGHNLAYDCAVWIAAGLAREVFAALDAGRIHCTWVYERLGEISGYSTRKLLDIETTCKAHGIAVTHKNHELATTFGQFLHSLDIPEPWRSYALGDCIVGKLYERQRRRFAAVPLKALAKLTYRQVVLQLMSAWGMTADQGLVAALEREAAEELAAIRPIAEQLGFIRPDGSRCMANIQAAIERAYGTATPRTPTGQPSTAAQVLESADSPELKAFAAYGALTKTLTNDVPNLRASGTGWISTRYGIADTLRTTSGGDRKGQRTGLIAMQNLRQRGGVRECIRPRPGMVFYDADASGLELCSLAQICVSRYGRRGMADAIRQAGTPGIIHTRVGAQIARQPFAVFARRVDAKEPAAVEMRTRAKNAVFGFMGGLGAATYVTYLLNATKGKTRITLEESKRVKADLLAAIPDIAAYLADDGALVSEGLYDTRLPGWDVVRRGVWYSADRNNPFQALAAAAMTEVLIDLAKACYIGNLSPARPCLFVHDEVLCEVPERDVADFDVAFQRLAIAATARVMPDVPTVWDAEGATCFSKRAKRIVGPDGRLQVWRG